MAIYLFYAVLQFVFDRILSSHLHGMDPETFMHYYYKETYTNEKLYNKNWNHFEKLSATNTQILEEKF